jgi:hypothetical protein
MLDAADRVELIQEFLLVDAMFVFAFFGHEPRDDGPRQRQGPLDPFVEQQRAARPEMLVHQPPCSVCGIGQVMHRAEH